MLVVGLHPTWLFWASPLSGIGWKFFIVYFWMWKSVLKSSSGYTNHINYQVKAKNKGNKTVNDKRPRASSFQVLLPINTEKLRMGSKVSRQAMSLPKNTLPSCLLLLAFRQHWGRLGQSHLIFSFSLFIQMKSGQQKHSLKRQWFK